MMKIKLIVLIILLNQFNIRSFGQKLPDNYLPMTFKLENNILKGSSKYLKGFVFTMNIGENNAVSVLKSNWLFEYIKKENVKGTLIDPNGKSTEIKYEIVNHRNTPEIYMKTNQGYFLWEFIKIKKKKISLAINWWYCPPPTHIDLEILEFVEELLSKPENWHKTDDRKCEEDETNNLWSLFCALKFASLEKAKEYNHHNTAIQTVRFVIDDLQPNHQYKHTLMDFNNNPATTHSDIIKVIKDAKRRIETELKNNGNEK